jgi:polysaccharide export outer membrane protein
MRQSLSSLAAATALVLVATYATAAPAGLPPPDEVAGASSGVRDYRIGPDDTLDINVFQIAELTRSVHVDSTGKILLPLLGTVQASGRTPDQLSMDIATELKKSYMKDPQVTVAVKEAQSQRVTVDGAVIQPGVYPLTGHTTLLQAVSLAKGPDPKLANIRHVAIFRTVGGTRRSAMYDLSEVRTGKAEDPEIFGNDIIVVDTSGSKSFFQNFSGGFGLLGMLIRPY